MDTAPSPEHDADMMRRAIRLAMRGRGRVEPNPMVGCIIEQNGKVVGEGYHQKFGEPHAEPNALAACTESPRGGTAYVTLEPCCHTGKKTPPCVPRLIEEGLSRIVIGCLDPNPNVNGKGVGQLRAAGIQVDAPVLEAEAKQLIAPFIAGLNGRPYITMKWAETLDRKVAGPGSSRLQISGDAANEVVYKFRARCDGIVVGINTVITDDPMLTARGRVVTDTQPVRFVLDGNLLIPEDAKLVRTASEIPLVIVCSEDAYKNGGLKIQNLQEMGAIFLRTEPGISGAERASAFVADFGTDHFEDFHPAPFTHLLIEPGPTLARSFFETELVDRLWIIRSPKRVDDDTAPAATPVPENFIPVAQRKLENDVLTEYLDRNASTFFAPVASADFLVEA